MLQLLFVSILLIIEIAHGFQLFEPSIECTVIKVHSTKNVLGHPKFPLLYQSINNNPTKSVLIIAGKKLPGVVPKTILKTDNFEKISIVIENKNIELELKGKPISRNGTLKLDGELLADVTCH